MKKIIGLLFILATILIVACQKQPKASFNISGSNYKTGESVSFSNTSSDAASFEWDFGDGSKSTDKNPSHIYSTQGSYTVTLTAFSKNEKKKNSSSKNVSITATTLGGGSGAAIDFTFSPTNPGVGILVQFSSQNTTTSEAWDFGDGATSTSSNPTHTYTSAGTFQVTLSANGTTKTKPVVVSSAPPTNNIPGNYSVTENCNSGNYNYSSSITATGQANTYACSNFGGYNVIVNFTVNGSTITVPNQVVAGATFSGSGNIISSNSFVINYSASDGTNTETCTANFVK